MSMTASNPWHDAVLAQCMSVEAAYNAADPDATLRALIDWHRQDATAIAADINDTNAKLADHYLKALATSPVAPSPELLTAVREAGAAKFYPERQSKPDEMLYLVGQGFLEKFAELVLAAAPQAQPMAKARSLTDELMDCVDRLGSEKDTVDPRVWDHLRVYAPKPAPVAQQPLTPHQLCNLAQQSRAVEGEHFLPVTYGWAVMRACAAAWGVKLPDTPDTDSDLA
jgi:hypothetical protein